MPYGNIVAGKKETPAQTKKMESCVAGVMKGGKSKSIAIAICKSALQKTLKKK